MTELDYSVLDPLEPLDENKGVDYSVLEPLTPETRAKDKQQKDIAELTARKEALEGQIATVKDTPVPKPTSEMSALGWSNVPRMGGLETSLQKTQSELSEAENRDIFWDTVMFDDFKHDERTIKALKESLDNVSRNPSPNLEPDKHYHNTERLNKIAKHYENEDEQSQVYRHFTEEELFDEKTRQKRFAELGLDDRAMADQIRGLLGNFEEAGLNIPVDKALATTVVNSVLDNMFKERVLELAKVPFAYDGEGNVQGKTGFGRSVRLNRQILDGEDYVEPTWGNLIKAGFKSVFYPLAGQNQAQAEYDRQLSELAQGKDVRITQYVSVPAGGVGGGMAGVQKVVDPKTWGDKMWLDFARTHNLMDAWEGIPKDASPEDKYAAMQQAAGKELYRKQQNRENAEEIMRITGTHPIRSGFGEAWGSLGRTLQFALGGAVVGQTAMKGAQEQSDRLLTAKFNEDGSVQYEEDSFDRAFTKGLLNASVETASEFTSEVIWDAMFKTLFSKLPGTDVLAKNVTKQMVKRSSGRAILRTARQMAAMGKAVHRGWVLSEHMEEVTAGFFNALFNYEMLDSEALATGSTVGGRVREFFTPENQLQTLEQVGYTTLLLGAVGLPIGGAQAAIGEYKANNALRSTLRHLGMDLQASEALLDRDLSTQIQATFNELGRRVKEGEKLDPVISTYLMAYYGASKDVLKNMSARERNDYLAKRLQEKSVIDDNNARALLHETGVKPEVTEKMNSEELQEAVLDVLGTLKNGLGEETLARILEEAGIDPKAIPDNIAGKVKLAREIITSGQFRVLQIETRKFDKAMQLEAQRMADAQAWAIQSEENSKATFEGDLTPLLESPLENPVVSDDNVTIFLDPENNRYVVSNKITGRDDMVFVPFTPDQKADAKALQEAADRQARIADVARETLNRRESIIQTAAGNLLRNGEKVTLVDNTEQAQRYLESKGIDKPVTGRVPGLTLKGRNEILLIRDNISSSMLLMETLLHERFHLALDNLGITNEQFAKFVAKATGLNEKEILEDAEKIRKTYSKQGVKLDLNQAIEEAVAHKLETGQLLFEPSLWRYLGDKALGIKSHKISNDLGRVLAGLDNIQSKFNKGWEADSAPLEEQGEAEQETQQPETEQGTEQEKPEATPEAAPETAPQEKISPKERDMLGMLSQVGLTKNDLDRAKLNKDQVAELLNTIEQWLEDGDNAPLDAILERFDLPRPEIQEKGEDAQDATPDAPVEEKTDQEAQSETETEPETVETEQEPAPEKEPEESKPEEKEPEPEPREPSITIKDLAKLGEDAKNGDKEAHKKLVELLGEDNAVILQGDVVDYDTATQEQLKDAEETGKVINDFPLSEVHFDPDRFQFRYIYGEKGASGALEGIKKYDKKQGGTLWLWRDPKDGKAYVVNGHNRGAAAIRLGVTHHNVAFFQAKSDGEARRMGAEMNIREGNGSALDAAKFFRETKMTLEDFEALNIPMRQSMGKRGYALAQLVESLFRKVVSGEIDESVGVAIGENLPDLNAQVQLMEYLKKQRKRDLTIGVVAEIAKIANVAVEKETKEGGAEQIDLFGEEVGRNKLILETAQVRAEIARRLGRDKRLFGMVSKLTNKERLEQEGNLIDAETGKAISQEAGLILNLFHILKETDLVKVIEQAAQEVANGTGISKAVGDIMGEVKTTVLTAIGREVEGVEQTGDDIPSSGGDVQKPSETGTATPREDLTLDALTPEQEKAEQEKIKEQKRKRAEREEIEKRTAAPLKGDSGDLTSTLPSMEGTSDAPLFTENDRIGEQEKGGEKAEPAKTPDKQPEPEKKPTEAPTERKTEPETEQVVVTDGGEAFLEQWNEWLKEGRPPHKSPMGYGPDADAKTAVFEANVIALANRGKKLPDAQKADIRGTHKVTGDGIKLKAIKLKTPREAAAPITSKDTTRRALNGVYYDAENQLIVATDGPSAIAIPAEVKESKIVLVGKTVVEQRDLGKKNGEEIEGEYPNWKTIEPDVSHNHTSRKLDIEATRKSVTASSIVGNSYDNVSGVTNLGTEAIPRLVESDRLLRGITALLESGAKEITLHYNTDDLKHPVTLRADNGAKFILMPTRSKFLREGRAVAAAAYTTDPVFTPVKFKEPTDLNETPKLLGFMTAQELAKYPKRAGNYGVGFTDKVPFEKRLSDAIEEIKEYHKEGKYAKYVKDRLMSLERANKILESAGLPPMTISELTSTPQEQETPVANGEEGKTKTAPAAPAAPAAPTPPARTEFIARGTKVVGKDTDGVAYSGEIEAYNAADDTYTLNVLKVKQPGKAMLPLPIDMKTGNRQVLKKNLPADSVNPIDVDKGPSKLTEAEKRKLRIMDAARDSEIGADIDESISERLERVGGEEVQTPGDKDAAKYGNKSVTDNEIRFKITSPVEERGQLVAVHNLGIKQLEAVVNELGGFAMPSVAVTKPEIGHTEFGEVSVLFGKDTIDPAKSSYNKIYSGDAYTPSFPEVGVKMNEKAVIAVKRRLSPLAKGNRMLNGTLHGMEDDIRRAGSPVEAYQYSPEMYALYAADRHGVEITPEMDMNALRSIRSDNPSYEDGYLGWLDETFKGTIVKKGFRNSKDTFAPSGARRSFEATHDPMTLANAVKIMRKKQQSGGQGGFFDTSVIGAARQPFKNIAQVKQAADQLTSIDDAEFNAQKRKVTDQWFDLASALDKENGFQGGFGGVTPVDIANAIAKSRDNPIRIRTFLRNLGYNKVSSELANDIAQLARDAAKVPTRYYEAKPARGVGLEEAKAVILPDSAPKSLVDALQKRGTHLEFYKADDKADRIRALNQVADTVDNVRFKITPEERELALQQFKDTETKYGGQAAFEKARKDGKTVLNYRQWVQVRTPAFLEWGGDWINSPGTAEVILNPKTGEPLVLYHGSRGAGFAIFDNTEGNRQSDAPDGVSFFTDSISNAFSYSGSYADPVFDPERIEALKENSSYEEDKQEAIELGEYDEDWEEDYVNNLLYDSEREPGIYEVFLKMKNPIIEDFEGASWDGVAYGRYQVLDSDNIVVNDAATGKTLFDTYEEAESVAEKQGLEGYEIVTDPWVGNDTNGVAREINEYETGAIIYNVLDSGSYGDPGPVGVYMVRNPSQIKSATANIGTFSSQSDDIRYKIVTDRDTLNRLNKEETFKAYRGMQIIDGKLYPAMSAKVDGKLREPSELGKWEEAVEQPEMVKQGKFALDKGQKGTSRMPVAYNPYIHASNSPLNDQFASAYKRDNLVTVEVEIPKSEMTSGYRADGAKDAVGAVAWRSGPVARRLPKDRTRQVYLTRWAKPIRIVPDSEVAQMVKNNLEGLDVVVPSGVVTPSLLAELQKAGVAIQDSGVRYKITPEERELALQQFKDTETKYGGQAAFEKARKDGKTVLNYRQWVQVRTPAFLDWFGDWMNDPANASKVVNPETGEPLVVYHGTGADFSEFDPLKIATVTDDGWFGKGFYFSPDPKVANQYAARGAPNIMPVYLKVENPYDWRANDGRSMSVATNEERYAKTRQIKEAGYDGVFVYDEVIGLDENESLTDAQWLAIVKHLTSKGLGVTREMVEEGLRSNRNPKGDYVRYYGADFANMMPTHRILREVVAFHPNHIKSAIANVGYFSDQTDDIRFKITPEEDAQQREWARKYRNGVLPIEDKRAAEAIIDRINAARGLPDVVYHGSPTAAGLMKSGGFDVSKRGDLTRAPSARLADFFAGNKGTSAIYAALELSEPMFGPWGTQPQNMNEVLGAVDDMVFGATYSGNRTQGDGSVQSSNPVFWNAYGEYIENVMAAKTAEQRRDLTIDFLNAEDPELRDSMIDAYEEELDRYTENSEQEAAEELYGDDIGDAWREDDDKRDEVYERAREYATNMVDAPKFLTRAPVTEKDLNISQFEWNPDNLPGTEGIERFAIDASKLKRIEYNKEGRNPTGSFAEHLEKAKQEGYEGVAFVDVKDGAGFDTVYALFENATRKSANPFTYDDKGELIPFSERAGDPTKDDIRYRLETSAAHYGDPEWARPKIDTQQDVNVVRAPSDISAQQIAQRDAEYLEAVERGDTETARRIVDKAALANIDLSETPPTSYLAYADQYGRPIEGARSFDDKGNRLPRPNYLTKTRDAWFYKDNDARYAWSIGDQAIFYRAGGLPESGRSYNFREQFYEKGVSVYPTPQPTSFAGAAKEGDWYFGAAEVVDSGSDGEPVVRIIGKWVKYPKDTNPLHAVRKFSQFGEGESVVRKVLGITDIVMRDPTGRIVPLSERFPNFDPQRSDKGALNEDSDDIRFRLPGETLEQDAEYMAAVESGDRGGDNLVEILRKTEKDERDKAVAAWLERNPETAKRLEKTVVDRARAAGYNVGKVWHGTNKDFSSFDTEAALKDLESHPTAAWGTFFTETKKHAENYGARLVSAYLKIRNPFIIKDIVFRERYLPSKSHKAAVRFRNQLIAAGYDSIKIEPDEGNHGHYDTFGEHSENRYVVFSPNQIKSAEPVTLDDQGNVIPPSQRFNAETPDIRYKITGDEVAAMWPDYFEDQEQRERLQALRGEREKFYSHENREITGIALDSSKATTEDFLRRVYKMGVETVQNRQADSEVVERSTNTFATEKGKLRALELVEEYASLDGQDLSQFNKRAPSVDERMLMFQLMRQHVFHLENASERFLRSEGAERNAIGQEMRALEGSLDRVITGLRVASTLAGRVLRNHQVGLDSLNMLVYRMARAEREKGAPLNEDEKREIMEKFRAYEQEHSRLTEELNQMEKQYQSERMAKEIAEREFAVAKEAIAKLAVTKATTRELQNLIEWEDGVMFKITPEEDAAYLDAVESGDMEAAHRMVDDRLAEIGAMWHGTPSGDLRGGVSGLHVGTKQAATEALEARIGIPSDGKGWDGTREYGKTLLAGRNRIRSGQFGQYRESGYNVRQNGKYLPVEDFYPADYAIPTVGAGVKVDLSWKPYVRPVLIVGETSNTRLNPMSDSRANAQMKAGLTKGNAKRGFFYKNEGEDYGSISAVFPNGESVLVKLPDAVTYDDDGNVIPLSQRFDPTKDDIRYKITPDPMSLDEIQSRVSTGNMTPNQFIEAFVPEALARGYEIGEIKSYLVDLATKKGGRVKKGVKQQQPQKQPKQPKQPRDPKKAKVPYNDKDGNPEPKKVAKYAWALALKEYGDMHGFELEEMSKEHLYGVIDNAVNIANEIMGVEIFDREQLIRLTTGYGKVTEKKRTEFDRALSKTRSMLLSLARINDLAYGNRAKKVETDRLKTVPLMRELAQEVLNMLDRGVATGTLTDVDIETVKDVLNSRFDNMRRALKMAIQELAQAIERGTPTTRGEKQEYEDPPDIKELKRIKKELQAVHDAMPAVLERKKALYLQNRVTNLKKQISALDEKIEKAKQGVFETVEKKTRPTTQEINDLTSERDGKKRELRELEANDLGQQAKRYEEAMKRLQEVGQQLTEALEAGETIPHKDTEPLTEKQLQLEARRRANTELRKQLRNNWALENEDAAERISLTRQVNTLLRQESRLQRLISDKDFQPRVTKDPPVNWQIIKKRKQVAALRSKYEMEARNLEYRMSGFKGKVKAHWETADVVARMWKTWADVSAFVQTGLLAAGHPILASRAFMDATSNAWSEQRYIEFWQKIEQDPFYQAFIVNGGKAHQEVDVYQGGNAADVLVETMKGSQNKVTSVVGQGIDVSQKHFNILVSMIRFYAFKSIVAGQNLDINNKEHAVQLKQIANMVNQLGGAGTMPGKNLKKMFWSSAMMAAQIATATGGAGIIYNATLKGEAGKRHVWYEATPGAWKEALRIHAGLLAANLLMNVFQMLLAKLSGDDDPELGDWEGLQTDSTWDMMWRLYSRTFGPQKVGKTNILINGAYPILRLMHETAKTLTDYDTETSKTRKIGGELARFASGRANPLMSDIVQLLLGRDYMGEPYGPMIFPKLFESQFAKDEKKVTWGDVGQGMVNMTINTLVPLAQRDLIETTVDVAEEFGIFGLMAAPVTMSLAMMGWAKSTYPVSHTRQRFEVEKIMRDYERIKKEGTREQQAEYRERYGWVVRNEKGFKSHIKRMRDARKSGDEDKIRETGRDFYHYYIEKTERSGVGALW